jgi:hypothetical protein
MRVRRVEKVRSAGTSDDPLTRVDRREGREDGNLIRGEGIFLGKGRKRRVEVPEYAGDVDSGPEHEFGS